MQHKIGYRQQKGLKTKPNSPSLIIHKKSPRRVLGTSNLQIPKLHLDIETLSFRNQTKKYTKSDNPLHCQQRAHTFIIFDIQKHPIQANYPNTTNIASKHKNKRKPPRRCTSNEKAEQEERACGTRKRS